MPERMVKRLAVLSASVTLVIGAGCEGNKKLSASQAGAHAADLVKIVEQDVQEVRAGLPEGAKHLAKLFEGSTLPKDDLKSVREGLENARNKVQDLRVAKSTFFALTDDQGQILRNDQEQDSMAGKKLFEPFPGLRPALGGKYSEARGQMPEAARVKGPDGQWVAAAPVGAPGQVKGLYVTGWSWSAYAYRLENSLRGTVRSQVARTGGKEPLIYVYMVVDKQAFGAPVSPEVNAKAVEAQDPLSKMQGDATFVTTVDITGRDFGLAVKRAPAAGSDVAVAVLRSET